MLKYYHLAYRIGRNVKTMVLFTLVVTVGIWFLSHDKIVDAGHFEGTLISFDYFQHYTHVSSRYNDTNDCNTSIDILVQFVKAKHNEKLQKNFVNFAVSLLSRTSCNITMYITCDKEGKEIAEVLFSVIESNIGWLVFPQRIYLDIFNLAKTMVRVIKPMRELFTSNANSYYKDVLFFISLALHRVLPHNLSKIIMLDIDLQLRADIRDLYAFFNEMNSRQIIAIAEEQQPVYWHITWEYREKNPGVSPAHGYTGFNSGVMLMNLAAMRNSRIYNMYLDDRFKLVQLARKYIYRGHLGDQDFYSLLSFDHMELFYSLPCQWNRQLCEWWRHNGYSDVFDLYFECSPPYYILHGNCDTLIP